MNSTELCQELIPENYTAIYARHSTKDTKSASNVTQIDQCKEVSSKLNLIVYKSYEDEGSGFTIPPEKRKGFKQLILDARAGYFKNLIIWKVDRLWRQTYDYPDTVKLLESLGVKLIFSDMLEFKNMNPIYKNFMINMFLSIAELEPNKILEKTSNGRNHKRNIGITFLRFKNFGFTLVKDRSFINDKINDEAIAKETKIYYKKNPLEAAFIHSCFKLYNNASGNYNIRIKKVQQEIITLGETFKTVTISNFKDKIQCVSDGIEFSPIKNELRELQKKLSKYNSKELRLLIEKCCTHCVTTTTLEYMLTNHHYCKINVINATNNKNLLILDDTNSHYMLNNTVYNMAVNVDAIVDKNLWFEVATHILNCKRLETSNKVNDILGIEIKCGKCKSKLRLSNDTYNCPICSLNISTCVITASIIDQVIDDDIFSKIKEKLKLINVSIDSDILTLEKEIKEHEKNCIKLALDYIATNSTSLAKLISSESKKTQEIQTSIAKLQQSKETYLKEIAKQSPLVGNGCALRENLTNYVANNKSTSTNLLKSIIRSVTITGDKINTKYNKF